MVGRASTTSRGNFAFGAAAHGTRSGPLAPVDLMIGPDSRNSSYDNLAAAAAAHTPHSSIPTPYTSTPPRFPSAAASPYPLSSSPHMASSPAIPRPSGSMPRLSASLTAYPAFRTGGAMPRVQSSGELTAAAAQAAGVADRIPEEGMGAGDGGTGSASPGVTVLPGVAGIPGPEEAVSGGVGAGRAGTAVAGPAVAGQAVASPPHRMGGRPGTPSHGLDPGRMHEPLGPAAAVSLAAEAEAAAAMAAAASAVPSVAAAAAAAAAAAVPQPVPVEPSRVDPSPTPPPAPAAQQRMQRLLIVANRLPVRASLQPDGTWALELSAGGLVSALLGVKQNFETCWIGWPGLYLHSPADQQQLHDALQAKGCVPVFLDENTMNAYYNGYCNNVLWPLLHYIGLPQEDRLSATRSIQAQYGAYRSANHSFADVVMAQYRQGDIVWVHDYHLMLLPQYLKARSPNMKVGWFLHTPFPSSEFFRALPLREEILQAVLAADLIGFHTYDYGRHFVSACARILGLEGTPEGVEDHGRLTRVAAFPIGIDPERFISALESNVVKTHIAELRARFSGRKVMLGVDRLDMIKGIPQKLIAFEKFLEEHPDWRDKVLLVQIAVPSRTDVPEWAAQSLGAGALLVNPWNITDMSSAIEDALTMGEEERVDRHRYNFLHVTTHTAQAWADTFVSELNDTVVEAQLRTLHIPPLLPVAQCVDRFHQCRNRLLILGYNGTLTAQVEPHRRRTPDQIKEMKVRLHPIMPAVLRRLSSDPANTVVIMSGSERAVLDEAFSEYDVWLAAENGMFMRHTRGEWMTTMPEHLNMDWLDSVQLVFEYFTERTPRSYVEERETSLVWNYKYADVEFGRVQARDMLQHLWTGPISNTAVDVVQVWLVAVQVWLVAVQVWLVAVQVWLVAVQVWLVAVQARDMLQHLWTGADFQHGRGCGAVEVRPVGVSKGAAMERVLGEIVHQKPLPCPFDFVMTVGHFLSRDEDIYQFFEPDLPHDNNMPPGMDAYQQGMDGTMGPMDGNCGVSMDGNMVTMGHASLDGAAMDQVTRDHITALEHADSYLPEYYTSSSPTTTFDTSTTATSTLTAPHDRSNPPPDTKPPPGLPPAPPPSVPGPDSLGSAPLPIHSGTTGVSDESGFSTQESSSMLPTVLDSEEDGHGEEISHRSSGEYCPIVDLNADSYFSCAVGRKRSLARYSLATTDDVVTMLKAISDSYGLGPGFRTA
ncbi:unnamed protein product [Closterium sp. Yama58-4]|nr:unnamed protein product [Closterium sp. Yama58-4]